MQSDQQVKNIWGCSSGNAIVRWCLEEPVDIGLYILNDVTVMVFPEDFKYNAMQHRYSKDDVRNANPDVLEGLIITWAFNWMIKLPVTTAGEA